MADTNVKEAKTESGSEQKHGEQKHSGMRRSGMPGEARSKLKTDNGQTSISSSVVSKISGIATREIPGVHSMGTGMSRRVNQLRSLVPGSEDSLSRGVAVEVGEKEAAVDLDVVTWYGQSIVDVTTAVRDNVISRVEEMTGLRVVEVNINVDNVYVEGDSDDESEGRVQ